ncbi:MAG: hypothetical protein FXF54_05180 [Kosmotoga sp.]|nr:MAG: hypothetical protein FXF54_05180 [Kosmotoga sp.]
MEFKLSTKEHVRLIEICEKFAGSVEPGFRYIHLYYWKGLKLFVTDGCGKLEIPLNKKVEEFDGSYAFPIDKAKVLKEQRSDDVYIKIKTKGKDLLITTSEESLELRNAFSSERPKMERKFEGLFDQKLTDFKNAINFASSPGDEGDTIGLVSNEKRTAVVAQSSNLTTISFLSAGINRELAVAFPYVTARHLVKTLEHIKSEKIIVGEGIRDIGLKIGKLLFSICRDTEVTIDKEILSLPENIETSTVYSKKHFQYALRKMCRVVGRGFSVLLIQNEKGTQFLSKVGNTKYEINIDKKPYKKQLIAKVEPHRLRSAISRMGGEKIKMSVYNKKMILSDSKDRYFALFPIL